MCGIVGVLNTSSGDTPDLTAVRQMRDLLTYRGPDEAGEYAAGPIALGHRRLSIIDLSTGQQPMTSIDGRYVIVYNGEIYNYKKLREKLEKKIKLRTNSDTEVLLNHLIEHGSAGLKNFNGMFALALWDKQRRELFLARDRFGKKPLYYLKDERQFIFASELKSILKYLPKRPNLDKQALAKYFLYEYIPSPDTPFAKIKKLPAGSWLKIKSGQVSTGSWYQLQPIPENFSEPITNPDKQFDEVLASAVEARMISDVPVGVLLSGGLDSSSIAWHMKQQTDNLHSFSVSFAEDSFNEKQYSSLAAKSIGTIHHDIEFNLDSFQETLSEIQSNLDEPLADASLLPTLLVSKLAKQHVTVVLDGDGADELLYGYGTFPAMTLSQKLDWMPKEIIRAVTLLASALPTNHNNFSLDFKIKSFLKGLAYPPEIRNQIWLSAFTETELSNLLSSSWSQDKLNIFEHIRQLHKTPAAHSPLKNLSLEYLQTYLQDDILPKLDRATMYASLEARTPFLDPKLVSLALKLPDKYKQQQGGKAILKASMRGRIPDAIIDRPKKGFGIPLGAWLRGPLKPLLLEILSENNIREANVVNYPAVETIISQHLSGKADHRKKLWTLMIFHWWHSKWA